MWLSERAHFKGYDSDAIRKEIAKAGVEAVIPAKSNRRTPSHPILFITDPGVLPEEPVVAYPITDAKA